MKIYGNKNSFPAIKENEKLKKGNDDYKNNNSTLNTSIKHLRDALKIIEPSFNDSKKQKKIL